MTNANSSHFEEALLENEEENPFADIFDDVEIDLKLNDMLLCLNPSNFF